MGWQNAIVPVFLAGNTVVMDFEGFRVYDGIPTLGNLISSSAPAQFIDQYGNLVLKGVTEYSHITTPASHWIAQNQVGNSIFWFTSGTEAGPWTQVSDITYAEPPAVSTANTGLRINSQLIFTGGNIIGLGSPFIPNDPNAPNAAETWHSLGTLAGFTVTVARYRLTAEHETEIDIIVTGGGANAASVQFSNSMGAAYALGNGQSSSSWPLTTNKVIAAGDILPRAVVTNTGAVLIVSNASRTDPIWGGFRVPTN